MTENPASPFLGPRDPQRRPTSQDSRRSSLPEEPTREQHDTESTPLLGDTDHTGGYGDAPAHHDAHSSPAASWLRHVQGRSLSKASSPRWPTIIALTVLTAVIVTILGLGFAAPAVIEEYAQQALVFEPDSVSIDSFTASGVRARIQGDFALDGSEVKRKPIRDLGRAGTWIVKAVESKQSAVKVYLPQYDNMLLGTAVVPPIVVGIRDGETTHVDILCDLFTGDLKGLRNVAEDWLAGRVGSLDMRVVADVPLKSGLIDLGTRSISQTIIFAGDEIPAMPQYNITKLDFHEIDYPASAGERGMAIDVSLEMTNPYPISFTVPPLGFEILVQDCSPDQPYIHLADAVTAAINVRPEQDARANVQGLMKKLPGPVISACPQTMKSPLDMLVGDYMRGDEATVYVRGSNAPSHSTPDWITDIMKSVTVAVPFPGKSFGDLIRSFSLADVHFGLPDPFAGPKNPKSHPRISAVVKALVSLPSEMNFPLEVARVRARAEVLYENRKLGNLDLREWQSANSTQIAAHGDIKAGLAVESVIHEAPLEITDDDVFSDVVQAMIFGSKPVVLGVTADVDVETETALGKFIVRDIPAKGKFSVKPFSDGGSVEPFQPKVGDIRIIETAKHAITLTALVNFTNPTNYSATVPFADILLLSNSTQIGHASARELVIIPGPNTNMPITATWDPSHADGEAGLAQGRELLSQYISGFNTTITLQTHAGTVPSQPMLGGALSRFPIDIPTPHLLTPKNPNHNPDDDKDDDNGDSNGRGPKFIDDATFHIFTSTATFTLLSPLAHNTLSVSYLNATAYYNHTEPVGGILYELPFDVPPGASKSPALPVDWDLGSVGFDAVREAVGGRLKLDAKAEVEVGVGRWSSGRIWFLGGGIGAGIAL